MAQEGQKVQVSYVGRFDDGEVFDSTQAHGGELLEFVVGDGQLIAGFDAAVREMEPGQTKTVVIEPKDAYGERDDTLVQTIPTSQAGDLGQQLQGMAGKSVYLQDQAGNVQEALVVSADEDSIVIDFNSRMAGKRLTFDITLETVDGQGK